MTPPRLALTVVAVVLTVLSPACQKDRETEGSQDSLPAAPPEAVALEVSGNVARAELRSTGSARGENATLAVSWDLASGVRAEELSLAFFRVRGGERAERPLQVVLEETEVALPGGRYDVRVTEVAGPHARAEGWVRSMDLEAGTGYALSLRVARTSGRLRVRVMAESAPSGAAVWTAVRREKDPAEEPLVREPSADVTLTLNPGRYMAEAGLDVAGATVARTSREVVVAPGSDEELVLSLRPQLGLLVVHASAGGQALDDGITIDVFPAETDPAAPGEPLSTGFGGDELPLPAGRYDVRVSHERGRPTGVVHWEQGIEVVDSGEATTLDVALDVRVGQVSFRATVGGQALRRAMRVRFSRDGQEVGSWEGLGPFRLAPGRYDVEVRYEPDPLVAGPSSVTVDGVIVVPDEHVIREVRLPRAPPPPPRDIVEGGEL